MVGTDEGGMEGTDGGVLDLIAICCHPVLVSPPRCVSLLPACGMSTSSCIIVGSSFPGSVVVVLCCVIVIPSCVSTRWVGRKVGWGVIT